MKVMEQKNYNNTTLCLSHLIFNNSKIILDNSFINLYTDFPDYPQYDNHLFGLFKTNSVQDFLDMEQNLSENDNFNTLKSVCIDNVWYNVAIFNIVGKSKKERLDDIKVNGAAGFDIEDYQSIWKLFRNFDFNKKQLDELFVYEFKTIKSIIPEKDLEYEIFQY